MGADILGEYRNLVDYNPDPVKLNLVKLNDKDTTASLTPAITTVANLSPYLGETPDTSKLMSAAGKNDQIDSFNNKARIFNSHLKAINSLIKQLNQTNSDITKMTETGNSKQYKYNAKSFAGLLNEIVVSNSIVRKE